MELERGIHQMAHGRQPFGLPSPNVYLVQGSRAAMLVDSGYDEDDDHAARMAYIRQAGGPPIMGVLVTHRHRDHAGGAVLLRRDTGAPILAHRDDREAIEQERFQGEAYVDEELQGGETFDLGGLTLEVIHAPGHTMGSVAVLARERHALLSADTVLGVTTTLVRPGEGDLRLYVQSVAALREFEPRVIYPGHGGPVIDPVARMEELIEHRRRREEQVLSQLALGPCTVLQIRDALYTDIPEARLAIAAEQVQSHLDKLLSEDRVTTGDGVYALK